MKAKYLVGDIVKVNISFFNEPVGVLAYVYKEHGRKDDDYYGISLITENGCDLSCFSANEQERYLEPIKKSNYEYHFVNIIQLNNDFKNLIKPLF